MNDTTPTVKTGTQAYTDPKSALKRYEFIFKQPQYLLDIFSIQSGTNITGVSPDEKTSLQTGALQHTSPAKGEVATPRNRKRHYDAIILPLFMVFHNSKFSAMQGVPAVRPPAFAYAFYIWGTSRLNLKGRENMNIFGNESGVLCSASVEHLKRSFEEFFQQAVEILTKLGKQGYLLDKYLSYLFEATNGILTYEAASEGFEAVSTLNSLCDGILKGDSKNKDHPFYEQVKAFIETHTLKYKERSTKVLLYSLMLSCDFLESIYEQYYMDISEDIRAFLDIIDLNNLYPKIVSRNKMSPKQFFGDDGFVKQNVFFLKNIFS